jgi:hypothetical protein
MKIDSTDRNLQNIGNFSAASALPDLDLLGGVRMAFSPTKRLGKGEVISLRRSSTISTMVRAFAEPGFHQLLDRGQNQGSDIGQHIFFELNPVLLSMLKENLEGDIAFLQFLRLAPEILLIGGELAMYPHERGDVFMRHHHSVELRITKSHNSQSEPAVLGRRVTRIIDTEFLYLATKDLPYAGSDTRRFVEGFFSGSVTGLQIIQTNS